MYNPEDILSVLGLVRETPEGNLIRMLKDQDMSEVHVRLLIKLAKNSKDEDFINYFNEEIFPPIKMSKAEHPVKDKFWPICKNKLVSMGFLKASGQSAA